MDDEDPEKWVDNLLVKVGEQKTSIGFKKNFGSMISCHLESSYETSI